MFCLFLFLCKPRLTRIFLASPSILVGTTPLTIFLCILLKFVLHIANTCDQISRKLNNGWQKLNWQILLWFFWAFFVVIFTLRAHNNCKSFLFILLKFVLMLLFKTSSQISLIWGSKLDYRVWHKLLWAVVHRTTSSEDLEALQFF